MSMREPELVEFGVVHTVDGVDEQVLICECGSLVGHLHAEDHRAFHRRAIDEGPPRISMSDRR